MLGQTEKGALVIEVAIIGVVLIFMCFAIIDISRYIWTKSNLLRATQHAARIVASVDGFEENTYILNASNPVDAPNFLRFYKAKSKAENEGYRWSQLTLSHSKAFKDFKAKNINSNISSAYLLPYRTPVNFSGVNLPNRVSDIAIIRPGEEVTHADPQTGAALGVVSSHPSLCPTNGCQVQCFQPDGSTPCHRLDTPLTVSRTLNAQERTTFKSTDLGEIYQHHPIIIEMRARVPVITPLIFDGDLEVKARSFAFREHTPRGSIPKNGIGGGIKWPSTPPDHHCTPAHEVLAADQTSCIDNRACTDGTCGNSIPNPCPSTVWGSCPTTDRNYSTCTCIPTNLCPGASNGCHLTSLDCAPQTLIHEPNPTTAVCFPCKCSDNSS